MSNFKVDLSRIKYGSKYDRKRCLQKFLTLFVSLEKFSLDISDNDLGNNSDIVEMISEIVFAYY